MHTQFWWGNLKERGHLEDTGVEWRTTLNWILKGMERCGLKGCGSGQGEVQDWWTW